MSNERLVFPPSSGRREAEAAVARVIAGEDNLLAANPKPILIERQSNRSLVLYVLPVSLSGAAVNPFLTHARAIVLVLDPETGAPPEPSIIRDLLGLTLAEARVASLVGSGLAPRQAAQKLGITEETARTVLKRVFGKVGVSRQSEFAALMTRLVLR